MAEEAKKKKARTRPRPVRGIDFTVWSINGDPISEDVIKDIESAIEGATLVAFNSGHRLLTQTSRG